MFDELNKGNIGAQVLCSDGNQGRKVLRLFCHPFDYGENELGDEGDPDLGPDSVFTVRQKIFEFEVLLQLLEKHFYYPSIFIQLGNGLGRYVHQIG